MLHLIELQHLPYFSVDKCTIVTYDSVRHTKYDNYIFFNEICHSSFSGFAKRYSLCPFSEIFCSHNDPYVPVGGWIDWSYQIEPLSVKGPWMECYVSFVVECGSNWLALGSHGTFLQLLLCPFS